MLELEVLVDKVRINSIFIMFLLNSFFVSAEGQLEYFAIANDSSGNKTVVGSISKNNEFKVTRLQNTVNNNSLNALESYYSLGKLNDVDKIKKLSYSKDGSLSWMNSELKAIPDKFDGFKKLHKVDATKHVYWGGYDIYIVDWFIAEDKKVMSWYDAIYCEGNNDCFVSNLMINGSESSDLYATAIKQAYLKPLSLNIELPYKVAVLPDYNSENKQNPLNLSFKIDWLKSPYEISLNEMRSKKQKQNKKLTKLSDFLLSIWQQNLKQDSIDAQKLSLTNAISKNWLDFNPRKMFTVFDQNQKFKKSVYIPTAYIQKLTNMDSYSILGYLHAEKETYIIGKGQFLNNTELIVFAINNADYKLKQNPENKALYSIIQSSLFQRELNHLVDGR